MVCWLSHLYIICKSILSTFVLTYASLNYFLYIILISFLGGRVVHLSLKAWSANPDFESNVYWFSEFIRQKNIRQYITGHNGQHEVHQRAKCWVFFARNKFSWLVLAQVFWLVLVQNFYCNFCLTCADFFILLFFLIPHTHSVQFEKYMSKMMVKNTTKHEKIKFEIHIFKFIPHYLIFFPVGFHIFQ